MQRGGSSRMVVRGIRTARPRISGCVVRTFLLKFEQALFAARPGCTQCPPLLITPQYDGEQLSCADGPEHEVSYVNQQNLNYATAPTYDDMAYCTLRLTAGRQMTSFNQFSAYVKQGLKVERLVTEAFSQSSLQSRQSAVRTTPPVCSPRLPTPC